MVAPFTPPPVPSLCLCSHMYNAGHGLHPNQWTLREAPNVENRTASPALSPSEWMQAQRVAASVASAPPYPSSLTNASSSDPRWPQWRFWDSCGMLLPRSTLLHSPPPVVGPDLQWQLPTCLLHDLWIRSHVPANDDPNDALRMETSGSDNTNDPSPPPRRHVAPLYSVALQVFNHQDNIVHVLLSLLITTRGPWELVVLFDSAEDASWPRVDAVLRETLQHCDVDPAHSRWHDPSFANTSWAEQARYTSPLSWSRRALNSSASLPFVSCLNPWLVHVRVMLQPTPIWETSGNNVQLRAAHPHTRYWVSVQDDQPQRTRGWNQMLAAPLRWWPHHLLGVSARCAHQRYSLNFTLAPCRNPSHPLDDAWPASMRCRIYVRDTANRGPLLLDYAEFKQLGFFDELSRRIDDDDHDLFARAWEEHQERDPALPPRPARAAFMPLEWDQVHFKSAHRRQRPKQSDHERAWIAARDERGRQAELAGAFGMARVKHKARVQRWPSHDADYALPPPLHSLCLQWSGPPPASDSLAVQEADPWMRQELRSWWQHPYKPDHAPINLLHNEAGT